MRACVVVTCRNEPGGGIRNTEIENFALLNQDMQGIHDLFDAGELVVPVQIQDVDVVCLQFRETVAHTHVQRAATVAYMIWRFAISQGIVFVACSVLCGYDELVAVFAGCHPFADPLLGLLVLVVVGCINEVSAGLEKEVKQLEGLIFVHGAHAACPGVADGHAAESEGRDVDRRCGREDAEFAQVGGGVVFCHFVLYLT